MNHDIIEILKFFIAVAPCLWLIRKEMSETRSEIKILEVKFDGKLESFNKDLRAIERDAEYREERLTAMIAKQK